MQKYSRVAMASLVVVAVVGFAVSQVVTAPLSLDETYDLAVQRRIDKVIDSIDSTFIRATIGTSTYSPDLILVYRIKKDLPSKEQTILTTLQVVGDDVQQEDFLERTSQISRPGGEGSKIFVNTVAIRRAPNPMRLSLALHRYQVGAIREQRYNPFRRVEFYFFYPEDAPPRKN